MSVGKVSFGQSSAQPQKSSELLKDTAIACGVGAIAGGGINYVNQRNFIKSIDETVKFVRNEYVKMIKMARNEMGNTKEAKETVTEIAKTAFKEIKYLRNMAKEGINYKQLGLNGAIGAAVVGGSYLVYRGIKALFTSNKA